jgi:CHAD domain-containing protein
MKSTRNLQAAATTLDDLRGAFGDRLHSGRRSILHRTYLDTFDWRLHRAGARLTAQTERRRTTLRWSAADDADPYVLPIEGSIRFAADLPEGFLRAALEPLIEVRALLPMGSIRVERLPARVVDAHGDATLLVDIETWAPVDASGRAAGEQHTTTSIRELTEDTNDLEIALGTLHAVGIEMSAAVDPLVEAAAVRGRRPGDYSSKPKLPLKPKQPSARALRAILAHLLDTLEKNVDGILEDVDTEFLHDLRVASRRTRSALTQIKDVLPQAAVEEFAREFKWLGEVTNRCRDLDVNLLQMNDYKLQLGIVDDVLDPLQELLERTRRTEHQLVCRALRSTRFRDLVGEWRNFLFSDTVEEPPPGADRPIVEVAGARIAKAFRRVVKRGSSLGEEPTAGQLHRVRIDAKKLRYLLEFFADLYPKREISRLVKQLKELQDTLGGCNDMEVQRGRLTSFADQLMTAGEAPPATIFAIGRLADLMAARQDGYRRHFASSFSAFADRDSRKLYRELFAGTGS